VYPYMKHNQFYHLLFVLNTYNTHIMQVDIIKDIKQAKMANKD
jgi:hypothetical protein